MKTPLLADEKTYWQLLNSDQVEAYNQTGASCTFYAFYAGIVKLHCLTRGKEVPASNPFTDWKSYVIERNQLDQNGDFYFSTTFVEAHDYYFKKGMTPYQEVVEVEKKDIQKKMEYTQTALLLNIRTFQEYTEQYTYNPVSKLGGIHSVYAFGFDKDYLYCQDSRGKDAHRLENGKFIKSEGRFRIPFRYVDGVHVLYQCMPLFTNGE